MNSNSQPNNNFESSMPYSTESNFQQTLSGSETDVSTSNENLSNEEKYVIRHTERQEPQGQENLKDSNRSSIRDSLPSNRSSLDVSTSSYNTLIIHSAGDEPWIGRNSELADGKLNYHQSSDLCTESKLSSVQKQSSPSQSPSLANNGNSVRNSLEVGTLNSLESGMQGITGISDDYLAQSSLLKQLAKEVEIPSPLIQKPESLDIWQLQMETLNLNNLPAPRRLKQSAIIDNANKLNGKANLCESQTEVLMNNDYCDTIEIRKGVSAPRPPTKGREDHKASGDQICSSAEIVQLFSKENSALKSELNKYWQRIAKTEKLEQEVLKIHRAQEELLQSCERRERLERAARTKLQSDARRLQEINRALREQVDLLSNQMLSRESILDVNGPESLRRELSKREVLIAQLITQNKELVAAKERQEIELAAQRATLQEQRTHIAILDTALKNAQENVVRLEEENRKKQVYVERVAQLQKALSSLQSASDRREQVERKLRLQLEKELQRTEAGQSDDEMISGWDSSNNLECEAFSELRRKLREKDEKIMRLEGDCSEWKQRYLEETALRQAAIDVVSIPKDAKIAVLEKTSQETEKIIAEARNEKIRHMDEEHAAQKIVADLESRLQNLESKLAEKDAMIRVLQKHTFDIDVPTMLGRSAHHTPRGSLLEAEIDHVLGSTVSRKELVSSVLTSTTGFGSGNSYDSSESSYHVTSYDFENKSFDETKLSLDNQLKQIDSQLDSQLLSKRGLCCFPGFTNPVSAQRRGKIPKPLLADIGSIHLTPSRRESGEMLMLEKQGRTSQQQRMQDSIDINSTSSKSPSPAPHSQAPSSLPKPPRISKRSGLPRRVEDYRLPHNDMQQKKFHCGNSISSNDSSPPHSPAKSLIPSSRKIGEYRRLVQSGGSNSSLKNPSVRPRSGSSRRERDSPSTISDNSASSLPSSSKIAMYSAPHLRRGSSLGRESKTSSSNSTSSNYRIQF